MQKELVTILIPIYKEELSPDEYTSLRQCLSVLSKYPITLVCPKSLNLDKYFAEYADFTIEAFDNDFFKSIDGYNKLMMSKQFYHRFLNYEYILIYQLDAYVFRDELEYWCSKNYDYIGSPWYEGFDLATSEQKIKGVGNGGFSLRKVKSHYNALYLYWVHYILKCVYESHAQYIASNKSSFSGSYFLLRAFFSRFNKKESNSFKTIILNEDGYWSFVVPKINFNFKIASIAEAVKFSFEANPDILYKKNNNQLPFGCHAWPRYNKIFWNSFIK